MPTLQLLLAKLSVLLISVSFAQSPALPVGIPDPSLAHTIEIPTSTLLSQPAWVDAYIRMKAKDAGADPEILAWIALKESQDGQNMLGDSGASKGYFQISTIYHPEISEACAYDLDCSLDFAIRRVLMGKANEWSVYRFCRAWWPNSCPFSI